ncbi:MAG: hypothetical protein KUG81_03830 [Gammaproteobacteria bacterium]|nr:hypothetical protein [Gammaproteobacteria bacterium]
MKESPKHKRTPKTKVEFKQLNENTTQEDNTSIWRSSDTRALNRFNVYSNEFVASAVDDYEGHDCKWLVPEEWPNVSVVADDEVNLNLSKYKKYKVTVSIEEVE